MIAKSKPTCAQRTITINVDVEFSRVPSAYAKKQAVNNIAFLLDCDAFYCNEGSYGDPAQDKRTVVAHHFVSALEAPLGLWRKDWASLMGLPEGTRIRVRNRNKQTSLWEAQGNHTGHREWKFVCIVGSRPGCWRGLASMDRNNIGFQVAKGARMQL